jgi:hypothetical protein
VGANDCAVLPRVLLHVNWLCRIAPCCRCARTRPSPRCATPRTRALIVLPNLRLDGRRLRGIGEQGCDGEKSRDQQAHSERLPTTHRRLAEAGLRTVNRKHQIG